MNDDIMSGCRLVAFDVKGDERGSVVAIEALDQAPFEVRRVYYLFNTKAGVDRGFHSHRRLHQLAVAVRGSCTMILDDGARRERVPLDNPARGLTIGPGIWHEMTDFSEDCVLLVLADAPYDEADYIRDYQAFLESAGR